MWTMEYVQVPDKSIIVEENDDNNRKIELNKKYNKQKTIKKEVDKLIEQMSLSKDESGILL